MGWNPTELIQRHDVLGAQVAALVNGVIEEHAAGVLSLETRIETTTDSVFQIGSITKIWTSTLAQKLVNEGVLDLDCPIRQYLPEFKMSDAITARHLLAHTSGIDGNHFTDTGLDDDAIARFVSSSRPARCSPTATPGSPCSADSSKSCACPRSPCPRTVGPPHWGLGWMLYGDGVVGDTGTTLGQKAFLRVVPDKGVAVAVLTNCLGGAPLAHEIITDTLRELTAVETPPRSTTGCAAPTATRCTTSPSMARL